MDLSTFTLNPLTLALLILGIVEFIKKFGLTGNKLMLVSMAVGMVFAIVYKFHEIYPPLRTVHRDRLLRRCSRTVRQRDLFFRQ